MSLLSPEVFAASSYDYLIAGGGTAGLTLAARLTEDPAISVGVIEAGEDRSDDLSVNTWGLTTSMSGNPDYDWAFKSVPQVNDDNRVISYSQGRQLGGSSAINYWYWNRASQADIDGWEELGNEGWSWKSLLPYFLKAEGFSPPPAVQAEDLRTPYNDTDVHGSDGPVKASLPPTYGSLSKAWNPTFDNLGLPVTGDPYGGNATGGFTTLLSQDPEKVSRSYATTAHFQPYGLRQNFKVVTGALVNKVLFNDGKGFRLSPLATGVNFTSHGTSYVVRATREVILSAGVVQSPQLLELSGIGSAKILGTRGIDVLVENPNVGENLQDHQSTTLSFEVIDSVATLDALKTPALREQAIEEYTRDRTGLLAGATCSTSYLSYAQLLKSTGKASALPTGADAFKRIMKDLKKNVDGLRRDRGLLKQYELVTRKLLDPEQPSAQELYSPVGISFPPVPGKFLTLFGLLGHSYSRGSIHISSSDPTSPPVIDPQFLSKPHDLEMLTAIAFHLETVATTQPFASLLKGNGTVFAPGNEHLTDENVEQHVRKTLGSSQHALGTCAMGPRLKGGVVDSNLMVYGTENLRVVDASVIPIQPVGAIQSLVYAIAEKAADIIKETQR
ncbi:MAG: hypothetical protein M1837_004389 [Sclerophora amabilis]|nr:MAG: hypothetical protein M1837_004389 [Sclerophora amabilis]